MVGLKKIAAPLRPPQFLRRSQKAYPVSGQGNTPTLNNIGAMTPDNFVES